MSYRQLSVLSSEDLPSCFFEGCDMPDSGDPLTAKCPSTAPCAAHVNYLMSAFQDDPCNECPEDHVCWAHDRSPSWPVANLTRICRSGPPLFTNPGECCSGNITQVGHWWYQTLCNSTVWKARFRSSRGVAPLDWEEYALPVNDTFYHPSNSSFNCTSPSKINRDTGISNARDPVVAILTFAGSWVWIHAGFRRGHDKVHSWKRELVGGFAMGLVDLLAPFGTLLLWKYVFGYSDMSWSGLERLWIFLCTTPSANAFLVLAALRLSREKAAGRMNRAGRKVYGLARGAETRWRAVTGKNSPGRRTREKDKFELDEEHESHISGERAKQFLANWALIKAISTVMSMSVGYVAIAYTTHQGVARGLFADLALASYNRGSAVARLYAGSMVCLLFYPFAVTSIAAAALVHLYRSRFQRWLVDSYLVRVLFGQLARYYEEREPRENKCRPPLEKEAAKDRKMAYKQRLAETITRKIVRLKASENRSTLDAQRKRRYFDQSRKKVKMLTVKYLERFRDWLHSKGGEEALKITTDIEKPAGADSSSSFLATRAASPVKDKPAVVVTDSSKAAGQSPLDGRLDDFKGYYAPVPVGEDGASTINALAIPSPLGASPQSCPFCCHEPTCLICHPDPSQIASLTAVGGCCHSPDDDNRGQPVARRLTKKPPRPNLARRVLASWPFRNLILALFDWLDKAREDLGMNDYWPDRKKYQALYDEVQEAKAKGLMPLPEQSFYFTTAFVVIYFVGLWCYFSAMWEVAGERLCMPDKPFNVGISTAFSLISFTISMILAQFSGILS